MWICMNASTWNVRLSMKLALISDFPDWFQIWSPLLSLVSRHRFSPTKSISSVHLYLSLALSAFFPAIFVVIVWMFSPLFTLRYNALFNMPAVHRFAVDSTSYCISTPLLLNFADAHIYIIHRINEEVFFELSHTKTTPANKSVLLFIEVNFLMVHAWISLCLASNPFKRLDITSAVIFWDGLL